MLPVVFHGYAATVKRKLLFSAPRAGGPWVLEGDFDPRTDVLAAVNALKMTDRVIEIVVTDEPAPVVLVALTRAAQAYFAAGLGPDRTPPLRPREQKDVVRIPPEGFQSPNSAGHARKPSTHKRRNRSKVKAPSTSSAGVDRKPGSGDAVAGVSTNGPTSAGDGVAADTPANRGDGP